MDYPYVNVEETFDALVRDYGGTANILRDVLPKDVSFPNADYVFHSENVVAELKCMMDDNSKNEGNQLKLKSAIDQYFDEDKIRTKEMTEDTWKNFPKDLQIRVSKIFSHSIHARVKRANIQIRETKRNLNLDRYAGVLIIANDGLTTMPPAAFIDATLRDILDHKRESINLFIYLTVNLLATVEGSPYPTVFWMPMSMEEPLKVSDTFLKQLWTTWGFMVNKRMGITHSYSHQIKDDDMGKFWQARHIKK